jgi:hypothetical protein
MKASLTRTRMGRRIRRMCKVQEHLAHGQLDLCLRDFGRSKSHVGAALLVNFHTILTGRLAAIRTRALISSHLSCRRLLRRQPTTAHNEKDRVHGVLTLERRL